MRSFFTDTDAVTEALPSQLRDAPSLKLAFAAAADMSRTIAAGDEEESSAILRPLIARAQVHSDRIDVDLRADLVERALRTAGRSFRDQADWQSQDASPGSFASDFDRLIRLTIEAALKRAGKEMKFVFDGAEEASTPDVSLVRLLTRAHALARRLAIEPRINLEDVGAQEGMGAPYAARLMRLNYLAPDIVVAILNGRQPVGLSARKLMTDTRLPFAWPEQRVALGFLA